MCSPPLRPPDCLCTSFLDLIPDHLHSVLRTRTIFPDKKNFKVKSCTLGYARRQIGTDKLSSSTFPLQERAFGDCDEQLSSLYYGSRQRAHQGLATPAQHQGHLRDHLRLRLHYSALQLVVFVSQYSQSRGEPPACVGAETAVANFHNILPGAFAQPRGRAVGVCEPGC